VTDEEALLRAVIADPDDDAPRLIYADWLDEHGQGERAEFIRVQCEAARQWSLRKAISLELLERAEELQKLYGPVWAASVNKITTRWRFERGFVSWVHCPASTLLMQANNLFRAAPIRYLHIRDARRLARQVFRLPQLSNLRSLGLASSAIGDRAVGHLARCSYLKGLLELDLAFNGIGIEGARALAVSPYLGNLEYLFLMGNAGIGDQGRLLLQRRFRDRVHF
jgi:uncharacterized protein (TIGR02996 family)